jgi:glycerol-3-phosphate cytidylyltransferase
MLYLLGIIKNGENDNNSNNNNRQPFLHVSAPHTEPEMTVTIITFGTYDCLHRGHVRIFERIKEDFPGSRLVVGVSSDALNYSKKGRYPVISEKDRMFMCSAIKYVDEVFVEESLEKKDEYCDRYGAVSLVMGDDHVGKFNWVTEATGGRCSVKYLKRTPSVSTTAIIEKAASLT